MSNRLPRPKGFTLIELLVVVSLIGILATLILANLNSARERARDAQRKSDLRNINTALRLYYNDFGGYPANSASGEIMGCGSSGTSTCSWSGPWQTTATTYMSILPGDPVSSQAYVYTRLDQDTFTIQACLENPSDEDGQEEGSCDSGVMYLVQEGIIPEE